MLCNRVVWLFHLGYSAAIIVFDENKMDVMGLIMCLYGLIYLLLVILLLENYKMYRYYQAMEDENEVLKGEKAV